VSLCIYVNNDTLCNDYVNKCQLFKINNNIEVCVLHVVGYWVFDRIRPA